MVNHPTSAELETLYQNKGHEAVVWYAWRNALRSLPALGNGQLQEVWKDQPVHYVYAVCRVLMVLAQWMRADNVRDATKAAASAVDYAVDSAISVSDDALFAAVGDVFSDVDAYYAAGSAARAAARAADTANAANAASAANVAALAGAEAADAASAAAGAHVAAAADADYNLLCHHHGTLDQVFWHSHPLWEKGTFGGGGEPEWFRQSRDSLVYQLNQLGLSFLADDLNTLWQGQPLSAHAENYLKNLSVTITNDRELLNRAILGEEVENVHAVRVLLLGPGGAGKSSLADRLQGKAIKVANPMTVGIDYQQHRPLNLREIFPSNGLQDKKLDLYLWDFGGQTIFHGLHSAFLHENCVYVLVVDSRHEQAPDEWLYQIRHLAGSQAKVLLVTNWYEQCETRQNETRLLREFPGLLQRGSFFYFSCLDTHAPGFIAFMQALVHTSLDSQRMVMRETLDVQQTLEKQYQNDIFLKEDKLKTLIAEKTNRTGDTASTLRQLEQLGFLVRIEKGKSRYCLKPTWAVDNAYQLLYSPELRKANGILNLAALESVFADKLGEDHLEYLVCFMQERHLCRQLQTGEGSYFFPDATMADEPPEVLQLLEQENKLTLRFDLPYLPLGFHARLVHRLFVPHNNVGISSPSEIWREGFVMRAQDSRAVVQYLLRKNVIEMNLTGSLEDFASLLAEFHMHLKAVVVSGNDIRAEQIYPFVLLKQQLFSVHSSEALIGVIGQVKGYDEFISEVRKMAGKIVNYGQLIIGDNNTQKNESDNTTITVTGNQRQIISSVLDEMLRHKADLPDHVLEAVYDIRKIVKADAEIPTEKTQSILGKVWNGLSELTGFTADIADIGDFVLGHPEAVAGVISVAAGLLS